MPILTQSQRHNAYRVSFACSALMGSSCKWVLVAWNGTQGFTRAKHEQLSTDWAMPQLIHQLYSRNPNAVRVYIKFIISTFYIQNQSNSAGISLKLNQVIRGPCQRGQGHMSGTRGIQLASLSPTATHTINYKHVCLLLPKSNVTYIFWKQIQSMHLPIPCNIIPFIL